jgi:hemolysin III
MEAVVPSGRFSDREDLANAISHTAGAVLSLAGLVLMVIISYGKAPVNIISSIVFGISMIFLYTSSSIAHWLPEGKHKDAFFTLDQLAIFVLIAGTYTPLSLVALRGWLGWLVFAIEWGLALIGTIRLLSRNNKFESGVGIIDILLYVGMGWLIAAVSVPVLRNIPLEGFIWIMVGGLFYSIGILFFKLAKFKFHHLVWHLFVIGGTVSHFIAIYFYILS